MPGFFPKKKNEPEPDDDHTQINFNYMTMQSHGSKIIHAMTFQQIIHLLDQVTDKLDEEEDQSTVFHLSQIKNILRGYLRDN